MNDYSISVRVETWDSAYCDKFRVKAKNSFAAKHKVEAILFARHDRKGHCKYADHGHLQSMSRNTEHSFGVRRE